MLGNIIAQGHYIRRLKVIQDTANPAPAHKQGKTECCRSGVCCWRRPCDLAPGDEVRIAEHLGITPEQLFREYLVVDENAYGLALRARREQQTGGHYLTSRETFDIETPCVFLDVKNQNACKIHPVKPKGGADFNCGDPKTHGESPDLVWAKADLVKLGWDGCRDD